MWARAPNIGKIMKKATIKDVAKRAQVSRATIDRVIYNRGYVSEAKKSAEVTHNHPEGIQGAEATALAILLARVGASKAEIRREIAELFSYDLDRRLEEIRPTYRFDVSCQGSVPESIIAFLESEDFTGAIRKAISLGGDSDTMASIAGGIAQAFYKEIPPEITSEVRSRLPQEFLSIVDRFESAYLR